MGHDVVDEVVLRVYGPDPVRGPIDSRSRLSLLRSPPRAHSTEPFPVIRKHATRLVKPRYSSSLSELALPWRTAALPTHTAFYDDVGVDWKARLREDRAGERPPLAVAPMVAEPPVSIPRPYPRIAPSPALTVPCSCPHGEHKGPVCRAAARGLSTAAKRAARAAAELERPRPGNALGLLPPEAPPRALHIAPAQALLDSRRPETSESEATLPPAGLQAPLRLADALLRAEQRSRAGRAAGKLGRGRPRAFSPSTAGDGRPDTGATDLSGLMRIAGETGGPPTPPAPLAAAFPFAGNRPQLHAAELAATGEDAVHVARTLRKFLPDAIPTGEGRSAMLTAARLADAPPPPRQSSGSPSSARGGAASMRRLGAASASELLAAGLRIAESVAARPDGATIADEVLLGRPAAEGDDAMGDLLVGRVGRVNVAQREKRIRGRPRAKEGFRSASKGPLEVALPTDLDDFFAQIADMALKDEKFVERVRDRIVNALADALTRGSQEEFLSIYDRIPVAFTQSELDNLKHRAWKIVEQKAGV